MKKSICNVAQIFLVYLVMLHKRPGAGPLPIFGSGWREREAYASPSASSPTSSVGARE